MNENPLNLFSEEDLGALTNFIETLHQDYLESRGLSEEGYQAICLPYLDGANILLERAVNFRNHKQILHDALLKTSRIEVRSSGGESIHRGYFCPSPIRDIVVGRCTRGRICRSDNSNFAYVHYFDENNRHIATKQRDVSRKIFFGGKKVSPALPSELSEPSKQSAYGECTEYILYEENKTFSILFDGEALLQSAECEYADDGRIRSYALLTVNPIDQSLASYEKECYSYGEDILTAEIADLSLGAPGGPILRLDRYCFSIENGYLTQYTDESTPLDRDISNLPLKDRLHKVKIKRRI